MRKSLFWTLDHYSESPFTISELHDSAHEHAQLADELGFDCLWLGEHHFHNLGTIPNPAVLLGSIARSTSQIRLGPAVAVLPLRDPTLIAEDYAMVDVISGGRLNMGVGVGSQGVEFQGMGVDFETRREEFERRLKKLKAYWTPASSSGSNPLNVMPLQAPMPSIFVATTTPERAYQAGLEGDSLLTIISPTSEDLSTVQQVMESHARGVSDSEAPSPHAEVVVTVLAHAAESEKEAMNTATVSVGRFLSLMSGNVVPDPDGLCRSMIARNTALIGTPDQISGQLGQLRELGIEHISLLSNFGGMCPDKVACSIRLLSDV